ncbi:MAG TPA: HD domain-containing protein [Thermoanaerobaculia bacterium]|nr:HD domain-containing protein [Thermoanaerobaculia bacterium]
MDSERVRAADAFAAEIHANDVRKGSGVPYIEHPRTVARHVARHGGTEDEVVAALLHDTVEDGGGTAVAHDIEARFGATVAQVVLELSDSIVDTTSGEAKEPWEQRKQRYADKLVDKSESGVLVKAADLLANLSDCVEDYRQVGEELWSRFNVGAGDDLATRRAKSLANNRRVIEGLKARGFERARALLAEAELVLDRLETESAPPE